MSNDTPQIPEPTPPIVPESGQPTPEASAAEGAPGQHAFGSDLSSDGAAPVPTHAENGYPAGSYPQNGYVQNGYPAGQNGYPAGQNGYPAGAYPVGAPAPKKPMSKGLLWGIIGGAVALVLIIAAVVIVPTMLRGPAQTASGVVEEYLTALSEGDAETAMAYVEAYDDDSMLTAEALAASVDIAPISDIVVEESEKANEYEETVVSASFAIGGETVERDFTVYNYDDDWQISDGLISATVGNFEGLGLTVNGIEPGDTSMSLFPGAYQLALAYDEFTIDAESDTFVVATNADAEEFWNAYPALTEEGAATFRTLVRASVEECVALKTLAASCGMDITEIDLTGYTPTEGTVTRTITADGQKTLDEMEVEVDSSSPGTVTTYETIDVDTTLQGTKDGTTAEFEVLFGGGFDYPYVDFTEETPTVTWG